MEWGAGKNRQFLVRCWVMQRRLLEAEMCTGRTLCTNEDSGAAAPEDAAAAAVAQHTHTHIQTCKTAQAWHRLCRQPPQLAGVGFHHLGPCCDLPVCYQHHLQHTRRDTPHKDRTHARIDTTRASRKQRVGIWVTVETLLGLLGVSLLSLCLLEAQERRVCGSGLVHKQARLGLSFCPAFAHLSHTPISWNASEFKAPG